jgi:hypothetical protein
MQLLFEVKLKEILTNLPYILFHVLETKHPSELGPLPPGPQKNAHIMQRDIFALFGN